METIHDSATTHASSHVQQQEEILQKSKKKLVFVSIVACVTIIIGILLILFAQHNTLAKNTLPEQAKEHVTAFAKTSIQKSAVPANITAKEGKNVDGTPNPNRYEASWELSDKTKGNYAIRFQDVSIYDSVSTIFTLPDAIKNVSEATAAEYTAKYLQLKPKGTWMCKTVSQTKPTVHATLCENFWTDMGEVKRGMGMISNSEGVSTSSVFYCELYPGTEKYDRTSCTTY